MSSRLIQSRGHSIPWAERRARRSAQGIECPRLWIKREDMTPLGAGGNKIRKLEHVLAKARAEGADVLLNTGEVQSNQVVQTAASAAHLGIPCELFLGRDRSPALRGRSGNREHPALPPFRGSGTPRTSQGAEPGCGHAPGREAKGRRAASLHHPPRLLPRRKGALGSLRCFFELLDQAQSQRLHAGRHYRHTWAARAPRRGSSPVRAPLPFRAGRTSPSTPSTPSARTTRCRPVNASWNTPRRAGLRFPCPEDAGKGCYASPAISWGRAIPGPTPA